MDAIRLQRTHHASGVIYIMGEHAVAATELVSNSGTTFVFISNASTTVNHVCIEVPLCPIKGSFCFAHSISANEAIMLGPWTFTGYDEVTTLIFPDITDLYIDTAESDFILTGIAEPTITLDQ